MAYLDVKAYFLEVEDQYKSMVELVNNLETAYNNGEVSKEVVENFKSNSLIIKANYERLAYVMFLFNKPKATNKRKKFDNKLEDTFEYIGADKKTIINENTNILKDFEKYLNKEE